MPSASVSQQGIPYALLRVDVLIEWESTAQPVALTAAIGDQVLQVPTSPTRDGRFGGFITLSIDPADERLSVKLRATSPTGSTSTVTKVLTLQKGGAVPLYRLARPYGDLPAGTVVNPAAPATPGLDLLAAKTLAAGIPTGFPGYADVGIPPGTVLTELGQATASDPIWRSSMPGQIVDATDFGNRRLLIQHDNVTITRSKVRSKAECKVQVDDGVFGFIIEDCDVAGVSDTDNGTGIGYGNYTARRCWVHRCEDAFRGGARTVIEYNLTDEQSIGLLSQSTGERLHTDGVQFNACANGPGEQTVVRRNTLLAIRVDGTKGNSAFIVGCENNSVAHVLIEENYCVDGSFSGFLKDEQDGHTITDAIVRNNVFGGAKFGDIGVNATQLYTITGNTTKSGSTIKFGAI
jgi:hypothetical protein